MSTRTTIRLTGLAAAMLAFLALAPAAGAKPVGQVGPYPDGAHSVTVTSVAVPDRPLPPDRADRLGVIETSVAQPPDRVDQLGSAAGPQPVQVAVLTAADSSGFSWTDALIGAGVAFAVALLAITGLAATRGRRGGVAVS